MDLVFPYRSITQVGDRRTSGGSRFIRFHPGMSQGLEEIESEHLLDGPNPSRHRIPAIDRTVVAGVRRRETKALEEFFEYYFDRVFALAFRLLGERTAAEDATQEIFYKIHRAAPSLDPERDPFPWLVTVTLNTCRSIWRSSSYKMHRRTLILGSDRKGELDLPDDRTDPHEDYQARKRELMVQQAIARLPEALRTVVVLHDYQGLDHKEIAKILHLGHDAVRKRYSRALAELGEILRGTEE